MKAIFVVTVLTCWFAIAKSATIDEILNGTDSTSAIRPAQNSLTEQQKLTLAKFRVKVERFLNDDYENTDSYLLGWLQSAKWDIFPAEQLLRRNAQWKRVNRITELGKSPIPADMLQLFPYRISAKDKYGCPVLELDIPKWKMSDYILGHEFPRDAVATMNKYIWQVFEKAERKIRKSSKQCQQFTLLVNLNGFTMDAISDFYSMSVVSGCIRAYQANYPGALKVGYFFNAPKDIKGTLEIFSPVLTNVLLDKVHFYFEDDDWKPIILSNIDASELGSEYGGTKDEFSLV